MHAAVIHPQLRIDQMPICPDAQLVSSSNWSPSWPNHSIFNTPSTNTNRSAQTYTVEASGQPDGLARGRLRVARLAGLTAPFLSAALAVRLDGPRCSARGVHREVLLLAKRLQTVYKPGHEPGHGLPRVLAAHRLWPRGANP